MCSRREHSVDAFRHGCKSIESDMRVNMRVQALLGKCRATVMHACQFEALSPAMLLLVVGCHSQSCTRQIDVIDVPLNGAHRPQADPIALMTQELSVRV